MKYVVFCLLFCAAVIAAPFLVEHHGYVYVSVAGYTIETSLLVALGLVLLLYVILALLLKLLGRIFGARRSIRDFFGRRRENNARENLYFGLIALLEHRYEEAQHLLISCTHSRHRSVASYIIAAEAAAKNGDEKACLECLGHARELLNPDDDTPGVVAVLKEAGRQLEHIVRYLPVAQELQTRLESSRIELDDICAEVEALDGRVDLSPARLEQVEERMSRLYSLLKKHNCASLEELIAVRERYSEALFDTTAAEDRIRGLERSVEVAESRYCALCAELTAVRSQAAPGFAAAITGSLRFLELDRAVFEVAVSAAPESATGTDRVSYLFSASGRDPVDVAKCASGGELSRIMLSLKAMMARFVGMPTLIFDEIDAGVSGSVADKMGRLICEMGRDMQVFSITHLPQVAAKGSAHFVVTKNVTSDGRTASSIRQVQGEERTTEIARLLSGETITPAAMANARELLAAG